MSYDKFTTDEIFLRKNKVETYDKFLNLLSSPSIEYTFLDIGEIIHKEFPRPKVGINTDTVLIINYVLHDRDLTHVRDIYNLIDLVGDLGGIQEFFISLVGIFVFPISYFSYNIKVLEELFLVDSIDPNLVEIKEI